MKIMQNNTVVNDFSLTINPKIDRNLQTPDIFDRSACARYIVQNVQYIHM